MTQQVVQCRRNQGDLAANLSSHVKPWDVAAGNSLRTCVFLQYELSQQLQPAINGSSWAMVISKAIRILTMGHVWAVTIPTHFLSTLSFLNPKTPHAATLRGHSCSSRF